MKQWKIKINLKSKLTCNQHIHCTYLSLGIPPPPPPGGLPRMPPPMFVNPNPPVAPPMPGKRDAEGEDMGAKKARAEPAEANLIPEEVFLSSNPNPVTFGVQIPHMPDKTEWKLDGNTIRLTLPLTDQVKMGFVSLIMLLYIQRRRPNTVAINRN